MESGQQKPVLITWNPPSDHDPNVAVECNVKLMVRGDVSEVYNVMLRALVVTVEHSEKLAARIEAPPGALPKGGPHKGGVDAPDNKKAPSPKSTDVPDTDTATAEIKTEVAAGSTELLDQTWTSENADAEYE